MLSPEFEDRDEAEAALGGKNTFNFNVNVLPS
jgi:hypothetical protein